YLPLLQADEDAPLALEGLEELDLLHGRQRGAARLQVEGGAVVDAPDLAVLQLTVVERVALVGALVRQRVEGALVADEHQLAPGDDDLGDALVGERLGGTEVEELLARGAALHSRPYDLAGVAHARLASRTGSPAGGHRRASGTAWLTASL